MTKTKRVDAETLMQRDGRIAALEAELAQAQEELKVCDQIINTIEGLTGHNRARSDMRADGAVAEIVAERDSLRLQLERTQDQRNLLDGKVQDLEHRLAQMTEDRNLWRDEHLGDCPVAAENAQLREQLERMRRPVTDEEWAGLSDFEFT